MASFDFIEAAVRGYEFVWRERKYLARVAFPVVFVKIACLLAIVSFGVQKQYLLAGLFTFPGFVLEGLLVIGALRYLLYGEYIFVWGRVFIPHAPSKPLFPPVSSENRVFCLQAGLVMYLLIKLFELLLNGYTKTINDVMTAQPMAQTPPEPSLLSFIVMLCFIGIFIWSFRLLFLYVPLTMNVMIKDYLKSVKGFESSLYMLGVYLICFLPLVVGFSFLSEILKMVFLSIPGIPTIIDAIFLSIHEVVSALVIATAITHGFIEILSNPAKTKEK